MASIEIELICGGLLCLTLLWIASNRRYTNSRGRTDFQYFLKGDLKPTRQSADFSSFLKNNRDNSAINPQKPKKAETIPEDAICIPIIFGTEYGFSKEISETLSQRLKQTRDFWPVLVDMAQFPDGLDLSLEQIVLFVCSTQGDGVPPYEARSFCEWLFSDHGSDWSSTKFSVCALGDKSYVHFCNCGLKIRDSMLNSAASEFVETVKVDREDWKAINQWMDSAISALSLLDLSIDRTQFRDGVASEETSRVGWTKRRPFYTEVVERRDLCCIRSEGDKRTVHIEFDISGSGLRYQPGDALGVYAKNRPEDVDDLMGQIGADPETKIAVPSWAPVSDGLRDFVSLRESLLEYYDLRVPKTKLFQVLLTKLTREHPSDKIYDGGLDANIDRAQQPADRFDKPSWSSKSKAQKLQNLLNDATEREKYLEQRHIVDVLQDFDLVPDSVSQLLECMKALQPRLYSISSSFEDNPSYLSITVAEVKYNTLDKDRVGVASTYLSERLQVGQRVGIYISENPDFRLPLSLSTPILMIGPGTGLAPFRSFILEKLAKSENKKDIGRNLLFFGSRARDQDFLYGETLESWHNQGIITLYTAFSREQPEKIYVQHRLSEASDAVWSLIQEGGHIYVCGDAKHMAPDVETCLHRIIETNGVQDPYEFLQQMSAKERYQRDVWF